MKVNCKVRVVNVWDKSILIDSSLGLISPAYHDSTLWLGRIKLHIKRSEESVEVLRKAEGPY